MGLLRSCFARTQTWLQAGKYLNALVSELPSRNGWSAAEHAGDRSPDRSQRLLNRASWDERAAMSLVRKYAAAGLDDAARRSRRRRMTAGVLDETGHEKQGSSTAGVKRQYIGLDLRFRTKGGLAVDILGDAYADGLAFDFVCGDEVYGNCTDLREYLEGQGQAYVLRVASNFMITLAAGARMTCKDAVKKLLKARRETGELAFHCFIPDGQACSKARLIRAAGLRWPVEESFQPGKGCFGLDQCQARLYTAILRHAVLVMAALAICAVTAAQLRDRTDAQAPPPARPDAPPPADPGLVPLTVREVRRLLAAALHRPKPPGHAASWPEWRRRHQARSRWFHQRARLARDYALVS
jgi:SRSO17 transposase